MKVQKDGPPPEKSDYFSFFYIWRYRRFHTIKTKKEFTRNNPSSMCLIRSRSIDKLNGHAGRKIV
jgi:hypothetical protein